MNEESKILLDIHEEEFKNYKSFIDSNNWYDDVYFNTRKGKLESSKLNTEVSIIETIIKSTNKFKEDVGDDIDKKPIQNFIKFTSDIINEHIERIAKYKRMYPLQNVSKEDDEEGELSIESEVEFHSDLFALITKTKVALSRLKIDENELSKKSLDLFYGNQKAPLMMRDYLCDKFDIIKNKTENIGINFSVPHINPATSNELLINMKAKDVPPWDSNKHFFEQEKSTIQFWEEEKTKIKNGINIGGYHLSGWLYWHTNIYKLNYGAEEEKDIKTALFRDNEYFFDYMYNKAKSKEYGRHGLFLYGTRRYAKALKNNEKLYYSDGSIKEIGNAKVGDLIIDNNNEITEITGVYPQGKKDLYKITFEDGRVIECCEDHLWQVYDKISRITKTLPLKEIFENYKYKKNHKGSNYLNNVDRILECNRYAISLSKPIELKKITPFIDPYFLGLWLGDGHSDSARITTIDEEIIKYLESFSKQENCYLNKSDKYTYTLHKKEGKLNPIIQKLKNKNLIKNKHIPDECYHWSIENRLQLLRGLMDTDGTCLKSGQKSFTNSNEEIINNFLKLIRELGIGHTIERKNGSYTKKNGELNKYVKINLFTDIKLFNLTRKLSRNVNIKSFKKLYTNIINIEYSGNEEATCIQVNNNSKLFLTTDAIVTHNSAGMASRLLYGLWTIKNAKGTVQGFSKVPDLEALINYSSDAINEMYPALKIPANSLTLDDGIILGLKGKKVQDRYDYANLTIINLEGGTSKKGSQKTAGSTPDIFLLDEAGKGKCIPPWKAAMPSFAGGKKGTWRLVPLISGTAGEGELSVDAESMLKDPKGYSILPMDWDHLEDFIDPDHVTWKRNTFGFFVPAQMSLEAPDKLILPFGDFLDIGIDTKKFEIEELNKFEIHVTDWEKSKEFFEQKRENVKNDVSLLAGETNSFPLDPEDCYITTEVNIFPGLDSKNRRRFIEENGLDGQRYRLYKDQYGEYHADMVPGDQIILDYPYKGGNFDAPVVMLENPLLDIIKPPLGLYTIGFDDVKQEKSSGDSVISATVFKRDFEGGEWANRFVAWFDSRPDKKQDYYKTLYHLIKIFNARVLMENEDNGFLEWMETHHMDDVHIHFSTGVGLASEENLTRNTNRRFGWSPTPINIYRLNQKMVMYTKQDGIIINGIEDLNGIDRINHPMLLEEMYKFKKDNNTDRIRSAGLALTLAQYYDKTYQYQKHRKKERTEDDSKYKKKDNFKMFDNLSDTSRLTKW